MVGGLWFFSGSQPLWAQQNPRFTLVVQGASLQEALETLARTAHINLIYPSALVQGKTVYCALQQAPIERLLACLLAGTGLDFVRSSSGAYVILEARRQSPLRGSLVGEVVDAVTGAPLPYAHVLLVDAGTGAVSNEAGRFALNGLLAGSHRLVISYVGYHPQLDSVRIIPNHTVHVQIPLEPASLEAPPVIIDGLTRRALSAALGTSQHTEEAQPQLALDLLQTASHLPGVQVTHPLAELHLQGGDSGEHLTLLDGMPIRNPVSLGRYLSAFSPLAIGRLTVHRAGHGVAQGSQLSGLIELEHALGGATPFSLATRLDPLALNARAQMRTTTTAGLLAVRHSVWDIYQEPGLRALLRQWNTIDPLMASRWLGEPIAAPGLQANPWTPDAAFLDLHAAMRFRPDPFQTVHLSAYQGTNRLEARQQTRYAAEAADSAHLMVTHSAYRWLNEAARFRYDRLLSARMLWSLQLRGSWHTSTYYYRAREGTAPRQNPEAWRALETQLQRELRQTPAATERNTIRELALESTAHYSFSPHWQSAIGLSIETVHAAFLLGNVLIAPFTHQITTWQPAAFVAATWTPSLQLVIEPGVRLTYLARHRKIYAEPRLALRQDVLLGPLELAFRVAGGIYRQFVNHFELTSIGATTITPSILFWLPPDATVTPPWSYHLTLDALVAQHDRWQLEFILYHKRQPHLLQVDYPGLLARLPATYPAPQATPLAQNAFLRHTYGQATGFTLRLQYQNPTQRLRFLYSYDRTQRAYPERSGQLRLLPTPWNEPYRVHAELMQNLSANLACLIRWESRWGQRWAFRRLYYDYLRYAGPAVVGPYHLDAPQTHTLPAKHRLDVGLSWHFRIGATQLQVQWMIHNVLNRRDVYDRSLAWISTFEPVVLDRRLPGRQWLLTVQLSH